MPRGLPLMMIMWQQERLQTGKCQCHMARLIMNLTMFFAQLDNAVPWLVTLIHEHTKFQVPSDDVPSDGVTSNAVTT